MTGNKNCKIKRGAVAEYYKALVYNLYENYAYVAKTKIAEFEKAFSSNNPFFRYGNAENYFLFDNGKVVGHIAAIADNRSGNIGFVGFFECENRQKYADILFEHATNFLKNAGKNRCRGPINMSVWQNFRVSYPENNQPFCLEPFTRECYRDLFFKNKFVISHQSVTTAESIDKTQIKGYKDSYMRSIQSGYSYELLNAGNAKESIVKIYSLTNKIFEGSYSFHKISKGEFLFFARQYTEIRKPHYTFVLKNQMQDPVGFFFAIPDLFNPRLKRVVIKTIGVIPEYRGMGLTKAMLYFVYKNAKNDGFKELIFSTMSVDNERIRSLTGQQLVPYRKYEVYEKNVV